jgi:hypothetical protein
MITERFKKEILNYVDNLLGFNPTGLYIVKDSIDGSCDADEAPIYTNIDERLDLDLSELNYAVGASKFVIFYNSNWVIKIPFTGYYWEEEDLTPILEGYWDDTNPCDEEMAIYDNASDDLKKLLVPNYFLGWINGSIPIYIQRRVKASYCYIERKEIIGKSSPIQKKIATKVIEDWRRFFNRDIRGILLNIFGIKRLKDIALEIDALSDLHSKNIGFMSNGDFAIFDYAGYTPLSWSNYEN